MATLKQGEAIKQDFFLIKFDPVPASDPLVAIIAKQPKLECCNPMPVLAEVTKTNDLFNDKTSVLEFYNNAFVNVKIYLQQYENGNWSDLSEITNNSFGVFYPFGFHKTRYDENAIGFLCDWHLVLLTYGGASYRFRFEAQTITNQYIETYSMEYCLANYTDARANYSVVIEWYNNGNIGDIKDDARRRDYGIINWYGRIRLPNSKFGNNTSVYENTRVKYQNGNMIWTKNEQVVEYSLRTDRFNGEMHDMIKTEILQADEIYITDFNYNNANRNIRRNVILTSSYEPNYVDGSLFAAVEVKFRQGIQNFDKKRC